jgi:monoterpene epsilon-lactone hydrolase
MIPGLKKFFAKKPPLGEIEALRVRHEALFARLGNLPADIVCEAGQVGPIRGEWLRPPDAAPGRTLLYFHGGGFVAGSPQSHRGLVARLARAGEASVFSVAYRLAPDCVFPAPVRDGVDCYRALLAAGVSPAGIVLAGDGAGGGLAFAVALGIRNAGLAMPAALAALSPWADLSLSGWSMVRNRARDQRLDWDMLFASARQYLKKSNPCDPYASPAFASFRGFPPIMVHAGSAEILRDDASRLGDRAAESDIPVSVEIYDGMQHLFQGDAGLREAKASLGRLGQFIRTRTKSG